MCEIRMRDMEITHDFTFIWRENSLFFEDYQKMYELLKQNTEESR